LLPFGRQFIMFHSTYRLFPQFARQRRLMSKQVLSALLINVICFVIFVISTNFATTLHI